MKITIEIPDKNATSQNFVAKYMREGADAAGEMLEGFLKNLNIRGAVYTIVHRGEKFKNSDGVEISIESFIS